MVGVASLFAAGVWGPADLTGKFLVTAFAWAVLCIVAHIAATTP